MSPRPRSAATRSAEARRARGQATPSVRRRARASCSRPRVGSRRSRTAARSSVRRWWKRSRTREASADALFRGAALALATRRAPLLVFARRCVELVEEPAEALAVVLRLGVEAGQLEDLPEP